VGLVDLVTMDPLTLVCFSGCRIKPLFFKKMAA
jgi:hypothetical protein